MKHQISIIIPVLNEAENLSKLIQHVLDASSTIHVPEIILVDGGSIDGTQEVIFNGSVLNGSETRKTQTNADSKVLHKFINEDFTQPDIQLIHSERGRAKQMNLGAKQATGNVLYFLHADSFPPKDFDQLIIDQVEKGNEAGCFRMQFDSNHWWLSLASWLTQFRWRACRGGDQSQFITRLLFDDIGGYDESFIIYEDNILINELFERKKFVVINEKLRTSARLYRKHGVWKLQYHFWTIYVKKWFGADADELFAYYKKHIC